MNDIPGLFADSLPDKFGNAVIDKWLAGQGRLPETFTAIERLCYTGKRGMGALEYVPATSPEFINSETDVTEMTKLASEVPIAALPPKYKSTVCMVDIAI